MSVPNPRYVGAPARMSDGRLFTDYRRSTRLLPTLSTGTWADHQRRETMQKTGVMRIQSDRTMSVLRGGSTNCVDTMVPELSKWNYNWNGGRQSVAHPVGIGSGRLYLPGRPDLVTADPDTVAAATISDEMLPGTYKPTPSLYIQSVVASQYVPGNGSNRYSMPYGR